MKDVNFKREALVKDLFNSMKVLDSFSSIEFESLYTFIVSKNLNLYQVINGQELIIPVTNIEELSIICRLMVESPMFDYGNINLLMPVDVLENFLKIDELPVEKNFAITSYDYPNFIPIKNKWIENNPVFIREEIKFNTVKETVLKMINFSRNTIFKRFDLKINYESFNSMTVKDIEEIEFWFRRILVWLNQENDAKIDIRHNANFEKNIYITSDLKLYLDGSQIYESFLFDLGKNLGKSGDNIPAVELNRLRQYVDLRREHLFIGKNFNTHLINYRENIKLMSSINEIPYVTRLLESFLRFR